MPHDSAPASEPVLMQLSVPVKPGVQGITAGLVRPITADPSLAEILDLAADDETVSEFLVRIAHSDTGFVARTDSGDRAVALIAATVAALIGDDIRAALTKPDIAFLTGLKPPAVEALRTVLLAIETDNPDAVTSALAALAL
ncbi:MAG: hypothetical protein JWN03_8893 [Nocardia sp.]|uniref:hypothetical protein n=1 Tax=Nocardia sp. TaxID=1821 RepID=UPI00260C2A9E|nr:hypothetical protein [Nocardia sp.]MCU1648618.1 hypothetical protein [Nocardia sp.]